MRIITVSPADVSLFHVAARELGSAKAWVVIAQANGIADPMITTLSTVQIPDGQTSDSGLPV